jgi:hypothetical protein
MQLLCNYYASTSNYYAITLLCDYCAVAGRLLCYDDALLT